MANYSYTIPDKQEFLKQYSEYVVEKVNDTFQAAKIMKSYKDKLEVLKSGRKFLIDYLEWGLACGKKLDMEGVIKKAYDETLKAYDERALDILSTM